MSTRLYPERFKGSHDPMTYPKQALSSRVRRGFGFLLGELIEDTSYAVLDPAAPHLRRYTARGRKEDFLDVRAALVFMSQHWMSELGPDTHTPPPEPSHDSENPGVSDESHEGQPELRADRAAGV